VPGYIKVGKNATVTVWLIFFTKRLTKGAVMRVYGTMQPSRKRLHLGGWIKKKLAFLRRFRPQSSIHTLGPFHAHTPPIPHQSNTYLPPLLSQQFSIHLALPHPYPAIGLPLRANRIPALFSTLSQRINIVLFYCINVTLLPQNALFSLNFIQKHRIIVQF
jgi:hypothetical protein